MKKILKSTVILLLVVGIVSYQIFEKNNAINKLTTKADELSIKPGKTKIKDLTNDGFTFEWNKYLKPIGASNSLSSKKYTGAELEIKKDGKRYASVGVINNTKELLDLKECIVGDVIIYPDYNDDHKFSEITVNNENIVGLSVDDIKKKFKEKPVEKDSNGEIVLKYDNNKYGYEFRFNKGGTLEFVRFDINEEDLF